MIWDVLLDAVIDCLKELPFLFAAFLILEAIEHHAAAGMEKMLKKAGNFGPLVGSALGCVPQCGFSVMASDFYAGGVIALGTLLSVYLSTSDEALVILLSNPGHMGDVAKLIVTKIIIGVIAGYLVLFAGRRWRKLHPGARKKEIEDLCADANCGCHDEEGGIFLPALKHTAEVMLYLFIFTFALNLMFELIGTERMSAFFLSNTVFQPILASLVGLIPNCAASVMLTQFYIDGVISFGSAVAGLCSAAGLGLMVLWRMNRNRRENLFVTGLLLFISAVSGIIIQALPV